MVMLAICPWGFAEPGFPENEYLNRGFFHLAEFSKDGTLLLTASGSSKPVAQLWKLETGELMQQFKGHEAMIHSICFSPDELHVLTAAGNPGVVGPHDASARVWDVATGEEKIALKTGRNLVSYAQYSANGEKILTVSRDFTGSMGDVATIWDAETQQRLIDVKISVYSRKMSMTEPARLSPDGAFLLGLDSDGVQLKLWNAMTGGVLWTVGGVARKGKEDIEARGFGALQFNRDGTQVLAACSDHTVKIWEVQTGRLRQVLAGHEKKITSAQFVFAKDKVVTASEDGTCRLWELDAERPQRQFAHQGPVVGLVMSNDGKRMATTWRKKRGDGSNEWYMTQWDTDNGVQLKQSSVPSFRGLVMYSPDSEKAITNRKATGTIILDAKTGSNVRTLSSEKE